MCAHTVIHMGGCSSTSAPALVTITDASTQSDEMSARDQPNEFCNNSSPPTAYVEPLADPALLTAFESIGEDASAMARLFDAIDVNGDDRISHEEFLSYLTARDTWCETRAVEALFDDLDANRDGAITRSDLNNGIADTDLGTRLLLRLHALRPPPASVDVFADLIRRDGPTVIGSAAERAITLGQLKAVVAHAQRRCREEGWIGRRLSDGQLRFEQIAPHALNLYDVSTHVILPSTHRHQLPPAVSVTLACARPASRNMSSPHTAAGPCGCVNVGLALRPRTRPCFVELVANGPQRPQYFVSHFWGEPIDDFTACIAQHSRDRGYGGGSINQDGDEARVWVCAYANRQWSLDDDVTDDPRKTSFHQAMRLCFGTVAIIDRKRAVYFSRVWPCYEIFVALTIEEHERHTDARTHGRYTYDVYTAHKHHLSEYGINNLSAVGLVDGVAAVDYVRGGGEMFAASWKCRREVPFPLELLEKGMHARVEEGQVMKPTETATGSLPHSRAAAFSPSLLWMHACCPPLSPQATVEADRKHILNAMVGRALLDDEPLNKHYRYDVINATLHGRVAADSLRRYGENCNPEPPSIAPFHSPSAAERPPLCSHRAIETGGEVLERTLVALRWSRVQRLGASLENCEHASSETLTRVLSALPASLEELPLMHAGQLTSLPDILGLPRLRELDLSCCGQLISVANLSSARLLRKLTLNACVEVQVLPDFSTLVQLRRLYLKRCTALKGLPSLSALTSLEELDLGSCHNLEIVPGLETLSALRWLSARDCERLTALPDLSALVRLCELDLIGCLALESMPHVPKLTELVISYPSHLDPQHEDLHFMQKLPWQERLRESFSSGPESPGSGCLDRFLNASRVCSGQ